MGAFVCFVGRRKNEPRECDHGDHLGATAYIESIMNCGNNRYDWDGVQNE